MRWTLINPDVPPNPYVRTLLDKLGKEVEYRQLWLDNSRPVVSKYRHLPLFLRLAREEGPFHLDALYLPLLAFAKLPRCVATVHDMCNALRRDIYPAHWPERVDGALMKAGACRADAIITMARFQKEELAAKLPFPRDRIFVSHWAIDHERFTPPSPKERERLRADLRARHGIAEDEALLLYVGGWQPRKNVPNLLRACRMLLDRGRKLRLLMNRSRERALWRKPVEHALSALHLEQRIAWLPRLDDAALVDHYRAADVLAFPTYYEGFGLPPLEAMATGCPVVASNASTMPEVVGDGGLMVHPDDTAGWADAIGRVLDDGALRKDLVKRGLAQAKRFTWETALKAHREAYESVARA